MNKNTVIEGLGEVNRQRRRMRRVPVYTGKRRPARVLVALVLCAGVIALGIRFVPGLRSGNSNSVSSPLVSSLATSGIGQRGGLLASNHVTLSWASKPRAKTYRLQVAVVSKGTKLSDAQIFRHPLLTTVVTRPSHALLVPNPGVYYWRVQGVQTGSSGPWSPARHFTAVAPILARPNLVTPRTVARRPTHLCWARVPEASGYYLSISGRATITVSGTCKNVVLAPGTHDWKVAAFVQGARIYAGHYSKQMYFTVPVSARTHSVKAPKTTAVRAPIQTAPVRTVPIQSAPVQRVTPRPVSGISVVRVTKTQPSVHQAPVVRQPVFQPLPTPQPQPTATSSGCIPMYTC